MTDALDYSIILSTEKESRGGIDLTITRAYAPPLDGEFDEYKEADQSLSDDVGGVLKYYYWGYPWAVKASIRGGFVAFQLPELMGQTLHVFIRIADKERIGKRLILNTAGDLLERLGLPRDRVDLDAYRAAKERKHTFEFDDLSKKKVA